MPRARSRPAGSATTSRRAWRRRNAAPTPSTRSASMPAGRSISGAGSGATSNPPTPASAPRSRTSATCSWCYYSEVAETYVQIRTLQARIVSALANVGTQQGALQLTINRNRAGLAPDLDVRQAELNLATTQSFVPTLRDALAQNINSLAVLLGEFPSALQAEMAQERADPLAASRDRGGPADRAVAPTPRHPPGRAPTRRPDRAGRRRHRRPLPVALALGRVRVRILRQQRPVQVGVARLPVRPDGAAGAFSMPAASATTSCCRTH